LWEIIRPVTPPHVLLALGAIALASAAPGCRRQTAPDPAPREAPVVPVAAQPVTTGTLRTTVRAAGVVVPSPGAELLVIASEAARLVEVTKMEGDAVVSGEVLVRFDYPFASGEASRQRAELARTQADLERARAAHARTTDFVARGLVPRRDQEDADRQLADAQAAVDAAARSLAAAEAVMARAVVRATFDGIVSKRLHDPGDLVQASPADPVLRIVDPRRIEVQATFAQADAPRVLPGALAHMTNPADGRDLRLVVAPGPIGAATGSGPASLRLTFIDPVMIPVDTSIDIEIDGEERTGVVLVPPEVILRDGDGAVVMVAAGDRAERRAVTTGTSTGRQVEIVSGLRPGELVITRGHVGLTDGAAITAAVSR
jgi:RND family efflux transporter MFP subunit